MKKLKIFGFLLCVITCFLGAVVSADYPDVTQDKAFYSSVTRLEELGIIAGCADGNFHPENNLTRAEFAKIMVYAMNSETEAKAYATASNFYDVKQSNWALPYISYITSKGIISGYPDGSFGPDKPITYAEALTILGKALGYEESVIGYYWPNNYINLAKNIDITAGISFNAYDSINRGVASVIIDRALFTDNSSKGNMLESLGYTVIEDCYMIASRNEDESLLQNQVRTSEGVFEVSGMSVFNHIGKQGTAILDNENVILQFSPSDVASKKVVVSSIYGNTVEYTSADGTKDSYRFENTFVTYLDNSKQTFAMASSAIKAGTELTFYGESYGNWSFAVIGSADSVAPMLATRNYYDDDVTIEGKPLNKDNLTVYRNGTSASLSDIKKNDVIYYNTNINTIDVYTKKVTGIYQDAYPSKAYVSEVSVGGKTYKIGSASASGKLDASEGSFELGEKVTLLLGKNDEVVFAVEISDFDYFEYGVLMSSGQRIATLGQNEGSSEFYAKIYMTDGEVYEYTTNKDYSDYIGKLVHLNYENSDVSITLVNTSQTIYGEVDYANRKLGNKTVLKDVRIIHRLSGEDDENVRLELLNFETLEVSSLLKENVLASISVNKFGDIGILYITGLSGSVSYGVLKGKTDTSPYTYSIYEKNGLNKYSSLGNYSVKNAIGVSFVKNSDGSITDIKTLYKLASARYVDAVEGGRIMLNGEIYKMHSEVIIVNISDFSNYKTTSIDEFANLKNIKSVNIYSDASAKDNGLVKVITFSN